MIIFQVCHASITFKIDDATAILTTLDLKDFPEENISQFSNGY